MATQGLRAPPTPARTGVWVGMGAISMSFAAYTSALVVRHGSAPDWPHVRLPPILYFNTLLLLVSSITFEIGRRQVATAAQRTTRAVGPQLEHAAAGTGFLYVTFALGTLFLVGQYLAWRDLAAQGLYLATTPGSAFFYVFTALHGLHLIGGLAALGYILRRAGLHRPRPAGALRAAALYWHFMGVLWLYLLTILVLWI